MSGSKSSKFYRVSDPLENFVIRLRLRETHQSSLHLDGGHTPFEYEGNIGWQTKIYSPKDIADYLRNKDSRGGTAAQRDTRRLLALMDQREPGSVESMIKRTMLYTYIDRDYFTPALPPVLAGSQWAEPYLGGVSRQAKPSRMVDDEDESNFDIMFNDRLHKVKNRFLKQRSFKSMYICITTDVDVEKLKKKESIFATREELEEHVICSFKLYDDGLLEMDPGFSGILNEKSAVKKSAPQSIFMNDATVSAGLYSGFRLDTSFIRSKHGAEFEFAIENLNEIVSPVDVEKFVLNQTQETKRRRHQGWKQDPPAEGHSHTQTYNVNINTASDFDGDNIIVVYQVELPPGWELRTGNLVDSIAEKDVKNAGKGELLKNDGFLDGPLAEGILKGITQVANNRPQVSPSGATMTYLDLMDSRTRIVFGWVFLIVSIVAVVLGPAYPIWIAPVLVIVFLTGTGFPSSSTHSTKFTSVEGGKFAHEKRATLLTPPVAHLGHLISFSLDVARPETQTGGFETPRVIFQVYSLGLMGRMVVQGYGYCNLPEYAGMCREEVKCWKALGNIKSRMREFFVGGMGALEDTSYVSGNMWHGTFPDVINRAAVQSESSGRLQVEIHSVITDPKLSDAANEGDEGFRSEKISTVRRTVQEILMGLKTGTLGRKSFDLKSSSGLRSSSSLRNSADLRSVMSKAKQMSGAGPRAVLEQSEHLAEKETEVVVDAMIRDKTKQRAKKRVENERVLEREGPVAQRSILEERDSGGGSDNESSPLLSNSLDIPALKPSLEPTTPDPRRSDDS